MLSGLELYERSQLPSKKLRKYSADHPIRVLRRQITEKRAQRWLNRKRNTLPLEDRLEILRRRKKQRSLTEAVLGQPNSVFWSKADLKAIKRELDLGPDYSNHEYRIKKANLKAVVFALRKRGFTIQHTSKYNNHVSSYYLEKAGVLYRFSDHDLPDTPERLSNRESGHSGRWGNEIIVDSSTSIEALLALYP